MSSRLSDYVEFNRYTHVGSGSRNGSGGGGERRVGATDFNKDWGFFLFSPGLVFNL